MSSNLSDQMNIVPAVSACLDVVTYKECSGCNLEKSLSEFGKKGERKDGVVRTEAKCKECRKIYDSSRYAKILTERRKKNSEVLNSSDYTFDLIRQLDEPWDLGVILDWLRGGKEEG